MEREYDGRTRSSSVLISSSVQKKGLRNRAIGPEMHCIWIAPTFSAFWKNLTFIHFRNFEGDGKLGVK
jgi:hypothetical protein